MKNFFYEIRQILLETNPTLKFQLFTTLYEEFLANNLDFTQLEIPEVFTKPSFYKICTIVKPHEVKQRKNLHEDEGKISLLHAIAHIEYSAIDLALDACYRFSDLPYEYYKDWLEVADDEIRHFKMICDLLENYGVKYGEIAVHQGLFEASMRSLTLVQRMAFIPRYMEANGLDSNQAIIKKLESIPKTKEIIEALKVILDEEISHVQKGDRWYKYGCSKLENFSCNYFDIVNGIYPNSFKTNKSLNIEARKKAGFSDEEIAKLKEF
ncbi:MAG: ferritin-like domain-containing protein [Epsilonproteobacteria bacterium]|nr:ferritin-like domain-containing protein [Campylobacterota bacterium]